jgi:type I restriction enzyme S subunit
MTAGKTKLRTNASNADKSKAPTGWSTIPLRYVAQLNPSVPLGELHESDELTFLPMDKIKSGYFIHNVATYSKYVPSYTVFADGDILLAKVTPCFENGNIAVAENLVGGKGFGTSEVFVIRPTEVETKFLFYYLQSTGFKQAGEASMTGAGGLKRISSELLRQHRLPLPTRAKQRIIADYLDRETARIDQLVSEKENMLALLEEKRAARISRIVTRGLNVDVPLKPLGYEWLGAVPVHWDVRRIKFVANSLEQGSSPIAANTPAAPEELGILKLSAVTGGRFKREENKALRCMDENEQALSLRKGDILVTRGNTPALVADVACLPNDEPNLLLPDLIYRLRVNQANCIPEYLAYFLTTSAARIQIRRDARGSSGSMVKVSRGHVLDWLTPLPPVSEQIDIVDQLQRSESRFDSLRTELEASLRLLSERRAALITAAMAGRLSM